MDADVQERQSLGKLRVFDAKLARGFRACNTVNMPFIDGRRVGSAG